MLEFCNICQSLMVEGACSNKNCGKGVKAQKTKKPRSKKSDTSNK